MDERRTVELEAISVICKAKRFLLEAETALENGLPGDFSRYFQRLHNGANDSFLVKYPMSTAAMAELPPEELRDLIIQNFSRFNKADLIIMYTLLERTPEAYGEDIELLVQLFPKEALKDNYGKTGSIHRNKEDLF